MSKTKKLFYSFIGRKLLGVSMKFNKYAYPIAQACLGLYLFANGGSLINLDIGVILVLLSLIKGVEIYKEERKHR